MPRPGWNGDRSDVWLTPPFVIDALGGADSFDLDPCAPEVQPWRTAKKTYTEKDCGLMLPWEGRVYMNPPYSLKLLTSFMRRLSDHNHGTALIFAKTETQVFFECVWAKASAVLFVKHRLRFCFLDGTPAPYDGGAPSVLVAYGSFDADVLSCEPIDGKFIPLRIPRSWLVDMPERTWRELVAEFFAAKEDPVRLEDLYSAFQDHPKAKANRHYREKLRQTLQLARYKNVGPGIWARG